MLERGMHHGGLRVILLKTKIIAGRLESNRLQPVADPFLSFFSPSTLWESTRYMGR